MPQQLLEDHSGAGLVFGDRESTQETMPNKQHHICFPLRRSAVLLIKYEGKIELSFKRERSRNGIVMKISV